MGRGVSWSNGEEKHLIKMHNEGKGAAEMRDSGLLDGNKSAEKIRSKIYALIGKGVIEKHDSRYNEMNHKINCKLFHSQSKM